jgi:hypothetical protein
MGLDMTDADWSDLFTNNGLELDVSVFGQLSSKGRTGILSMVISWKFVQGPGAHGSLSLYLAAIWAISWHSVLFCSSCRDLCIVRRREKRGKERERKIKENKAKKIKKKTRKNGVFVLEVSILLSNNSQMSGKSSKILYDSVKKVCGCESECRREGEGKNQKMVFWS